MDDEKKRSYSLKTSHPTYIELLDRIGAAPKRRGGSVSNPPSRTDDRSNSSDDDDNRPRPLRLTDVQDYNNR